MLPNTANQRSQVTVKLPPARAAQLQALATVWNLSQADTIGRLINEQIDAGVLPRGIPGVTISKKGECVQIAFDDAAPVILEKTVAIDFARSIKARAGASDLMAGAYEFVEQQWPDPGVSLVRVDRRGTGVVVRVGSVRRAFARKLAGELADLIEAAAA